MASRFWPATETSRAQGSRPARGQDSARRASGVRARMRAGRLGLADLLVRELRDHLEGAIGCRRADLAHDEALTLALEQLEIDHAAGLAIGRHEAVEMGPRMRMIVGALQVQHGRELNLLAALERRCRRALVHRLLGFPVGVAARPELA